MEQEKRYALSMYGRYVSIADKVVDESDQTLVYGSRSDLHRIAAETVYSHRRFSTIAEYRGRTPMWVIMTNVGGLKVYRIEPNGYLGQGR